MLASPGSSVASKTQIWDAGAGEAEAADTKADLRKSLYVEIFDSVHNIVLEREAFLFSLSELTCLARLRTLSYPARYLLIRLCLCKRGKWHTLGALVARYRPELGDEARISAAVDELCGIEHPAVQVKKKEKEERDVIDLTLEEEEANGDKGADAPARDAPAVFAVDDAAASVPDLLACLPADDIKTIARQMKVARPAQQTRAALIDAILSNASRQSTLNFPILTPRKNAADMRAGGAATRQLTLNFARDGRKGTQHAVVRRLVSALMGRCVRIEPAVFALFDRLSLVFFRSTTHSPSLLLPALLSAFRKRQYGSVDTNYARTTTIFPSRAALLAYEEALQLECRVDEAFGADDGQGGFPQKPVAAAKGKQSQAKGKGKGKVEEELPAESSRVEGAKAVRDIWEKVYDRWRDLIASKDEERAAGLERFECGHVLTRIVYKGAHALSILKEYDLEMQVLEALLSQTKWRRGHRGGWYDRLALVLMTHRERTQENLEMAMEVVVRGLEDDLTHMTYRPRLQRRLARLENLLMIPKDQRHKCEGQLQKAADVRVEGVRVYKRRSASVVLDRSGRVKRSTASPLPERARLFADVRASTQPRELDTAQAEPPQGKTIWVGRHDEEVSVEQFALEYYEDMGFKGFHSEGRIVSTIFGLLFWDIIFASVPGAFETPFQTAPLDIHEDGFYSARAGIIEQRLEELEKGNAREIVGIVDERERAAKTMCIGVDWKFEAQDLLEIVDCLGGHALAIICRMICEDYGQWRGGVPDLFIWNAAKGTCKFVEVKSPKDTLSENQKVWIDVLLGSETPVDLCHVTEKGAGKQQPKKPRGRPRKTAVVDSSGVESEDEMGLESGDENLDALGLSQEEGEEPKGSKRTRDSDEFIPSPKRRKVEVVLTPRKRRKR